MKFGDLILNEHAGDSNPQKILLFVRESGEFLECLSRKGELIKFYKRQRKEGFLKVINWIDLDMWDSELKARAKK